MKLIFIKTIKLFKKLACIEKCQAEKIEEFRLQKFCPILNFQVIVWISNMIWILKSLLFVSTEKSVQTNNNFSWVKKWSNSNGWKTTCVKILLLKSINSATVAKFRKKSKTNYIITVLPFSSSRMVSFSEADKFQWKFSNIDFELCYLIGGKSSFRLTNLCIHSFKSCSLSQLSSGEKWANTRSLASCQHSCQEKCFSQLKSGYKTFRSMQFQLFPFQPIAFSSARNFNLN